jgi:hypothetical protein
MPRPPINRRGLGCDTSFAQVSFASASSEPLSLLFISSFGPSMIENSVPRWISRSVSVLPGILAVSRRTRGTILLDEFYLRFLRAA